LVFSSTSSKQSYHFIHANPTVLFQNTHTLGIYIKTIFQSLLLDVVKHSCASFRLVIDSDITSIQNLISILSPYILQLRANCSKCFILNNEISVADIAHLIVSNRRNEWSLSIDLHVYTKNQQFRLYDSNKYGLNNPLLTTPNYPFEPTNTHSYFAILRKSIITNTLNINIPSIILNNDDLFITETSSNLYQKVFDVDKTILKNTNKKDLKTSQYENLNLFLTPKQTQTLSFNIQTQQIPTLTNTTFERFIPFINTIITADPNYIGTIHSCVQGTQNTDKLFFNITGNYRYCHKIQTHHKRNSTAIIIDISNNTYAIRCKDPLCDNTSLLWHPIHTK
jgi:hypothetical protein